MTSAMHLRHKALIVAVVLFALSLPVCGQTGGEPAPLSSAAQKALEKGLSATQAKNWDVAIRYFNDAHRAAPAAPQPLFDLGLAEAQTPGRELRAIVWFEAYLARVPQAANVGQVRQQITDLDVRAESSARKLIEILKALAAQSSQDNAPYATQDIARLLAKVGDTDAALATVESIPKEGQGTYAYPGAVWDVSRVLADRGRFTEAIKLVDKIPVADDTYRNSAYASIVSAQIKEGLLADAHKSVGHISDLRALHGSLPQLVDAEYRAHGREAAILVLNDVRVSHPDAVHQAEFVAAEYVVGWRQQADAEVHQWLESDSPDRALGLCNLAVDFDSLGRRDEALDFVKRCGDLILDDYRRFSGQKLIPVGVPALVSISIKDWDGAETYSKRLLAAAPESREWYSDRQRDIEGGKPAARLEAAKQLARKALSDPSSSPVQRTQSWCDYLDGALNRPLFVDESRTTLDRLTHYVPPQGKEDKARAIFDHVKEPAEELLDRLQDIRDLQAATQKSGGKN